MKKKVVVFGIGNNWKKMADYLEDKYNIVALIDNDWKNKEYVVHPVDHIMELQYDCVLIMPDETKEMEEQLLQLQVPKEKIEICRMEQRKLIRETIAGDAYGQSFEDIIIAGLFAQIGIEKPSYLDLGANHPIYWSNTYLFYKKGCRGINVEANPLLIGAFMKERPEDINLNVGIAPQHGVLPFYKFGEYSGLNTFCRERAEWLEKIGYRIIDTINLPVITLGEIIENYCSGIFPDFLDCDVEDLDYEIIASYDMTHNGPKIVCVEASSNEEEQFDKMFFDYGYFRFCRLATNLIYIRNEYDKAFNQR